MESDLDWSIRNGFCFLEYDFAERVGIILGDNADNPDPHDLEIARWQAAKELRSEFNKS